MLLNRIYFILAFVGMNALTLSAQIDWPNIRFSLIGSVDGFDSITAITHAGDGSGRLFVAERQGTIRIFDGTNLLPELFLNISNQVRSNYPEQGLLGFTFAPSMAQPRACYVNYTRRPDGATVISRFLVSSTNNGVADRTSEQVLLVIPQPFPNHNGGCLAFGRDGYLYIGMGDGGGDGDPQNNAQSKQSLLGKILRIDVSGGTNGYAIPASNPFRTNALYRPEIWALGLRNPWRFSFDSLTGDLYIGDAGQSEREEINFQPASSKGGENYGWRAIEGTADYNFPAGLDANTTTLPIFTYHPFEGAVIGGYVYRGTNFPRLTGLYVFSDFLAYGLWALKYEGGYWQRQKLAAPPSVTTFGTSESGDIYLATSKDIWRVEDSGTCHAPRIDWDFAYSEFAPVSCLTPGARIHYTYVNREPDESDPWVNSGETIELDSEMRLRAYRPGLLPSITSTQKYDFYRTAPPTFENRAATSNRLEVTIQSLTPNASIFYTTNGAEPTRASLRYTQPVFLPIGTTVKAAAFKSNYIDSAAMEMRWSGITAMGITNDISYIFTNNAAYFFTNDTLYITVRSGNNESELNLDVSTDLKVWRSHKRQGHPSEFTTFTYSGFISNQTQPLFFRTRMRDFKTAPEP
jgi:glucose/arabinose dehydrogenase